MPDPVSELLEQELRQAVQRRGLVVWLDGEGQYTAFADRLQARHATGEFPYPVLGYRGSFLELLLALEPYGSGADPDKLLIHLPGINRTSILQTPLLELYKAGKEHQKNLGTLIEEAALGRVSPEATSQFLSQGVPALEAADAWLEAQCQTSEGALERYLGAVDIEHALRDLMIDRGELVAALERLDQRATVLDYLHRSIGMPGDFRVLKGVLEEAGSGALPRMRLVDAVLGWLMCLEYVFDLQVPPKTAFLRPIRDLSPKLGKRASELLAGVRLSHPQHYMQTADELEELLATDRSELAPAELGKLDTFRFEEATIRKAAIRAVGGVEWQRADEWAGHRSLEHSFWLIHERRRAHVWELLGCAVALRRELDRHARPLQRARGHAEALEAYTRSAFAVDQAHRQFEQRCHHLLSVELDDHADLLEMQAALRRTCRVWADQLARDYTALCRDQGALPPLELQQRTLYREVIDPLVREGERVAVFLVDAMRFEMAAELAKELEDPATTVSLGARLAELPTITRLCMNALAPVEQNGVLGIKTSDTDIEGITSGEYSVRTPAERARAMGMCSLGKGALELQLDDITRDKLDTLRRRVAQAPGLIVVHTLLLDDAGEHGFHLGTFEHTMKQLRSAYHQLQRAGVQRFVFTSDHGYLLLDPTAQKVPFDKKRNARRRHIFRTAPASDLDGLVVKMSALRYQTEAEGYLVFRPDTSVWETEEKIAPFVHGGNSLQERVIPVLVVKRRRPIGGTTSTYQVEAHAADSVLGRQRLRIKVALAPSSTAPLGFTAPRTITLALRVPDRPEIHATILETDPPAELRAGQLLVPTRGEESLVTFELDGEVDESVRVEVYHPDGIEDVRPALVSGWFQSKSRVKRSPSSDKIKAVGRPPSKPPPPPSWRDDFPDSAFRPVFEQIEAGRSVSEADLLQLLGARRMVTAFSRRFDDLKRHVPFEVEIVVAGFLKSYVKGETK